MTTKNSIKSETLKWSWNVVTTAGGAVTDRTGEVNTSVTLSAITHDPYSGKFTPGVYRVTPHLVSREGCGVQRKTIVGHYIDTATNYVHHTTLKGDVGVLLSSKARDGMPSITSNTSNYAQRALQRSYGKLGGNKVGIGETLGELTETLNLLRHPFKDLREFFVNSNYYRLGLLQTISQYSNTGKWVERGGKALSGRSAAKVAANTWLEFRYGLMPLIKTVQDLQELVESKAAKLDNDLIRSARSKIVKSVNFSPKATPGDFVVGQTGMRIKFDSMDTMTFRSSVQYKMKGVPSIYTLLGLSPRFVPELAWELTKASFVVDWIVSIGPWLSALRFTPEIQVLGNTVSTKVNRKVTVNLHTYVPSSQNQAPRVSQGVCGVYTRDYYSRVVNQDLPILPLIKLERGPLIHTVDALALILQPVLKGVRK